MDSELVALSDEAAWSFSPDAVADLALEPEAWSGSDPEGWADSEPEAWSDSGPDIDPSELETTPVGDPISVCFSSDWETVTTSGSIFRGVPLGAVRGTLGLRGTYAGSESL